MPDSFPIENVIENFLSFSTTFNNNMRDMIQTYNNINNTYSNIIINNTHQYSSNNINAAPNSNTLFNPYTQNPLYNQQTFNSPLNNHTRETRQENMNNARARTRRNLFNSIRTFNNRTNRNNNTNNRTYRNPQTYNNYFTSLLDIFNGTTAQPSLNNFFQPVPILATEQQINTAVERVNYRDIETDQQHCPIDLVPFNENEQVSRIRHCGHIFRTNNLMSWLGSSPRCPLCRYDIRNYVVSPVNNNPQNQPGNQEDEQNSQTDIEVEQQQEQEDATITNSENNTLTTNNTAVSPIHNNPIAGINTNVESVDDTSETKEEENDDEQRNETPPLYNSSNIINITQPSLPNNITTIQVDTGILPMNNNVDTNTVNALQTQLGNLITDTVLGTFQDLLDPNGTNVDFQYDIFNRTNIGHNQANVGNSQTETGSNNQRDGDGDGDGDSNN